VLSGECVVAAAHLLEMNAFGTQDPGEVARDGRGPERLGKLLASLQVVVTAKLFRRRGSEPE
jgi:hypothetical protein